ncbi:uncharacterized protein [Prorops nasuta]|uniref:uncharacterized protein n=1 Tax=Prorops nasuta TaxID=863751 RepID=UPI0034CE42F5
MAEQRVSAYNKCKTILKAQITHLSNLIAKDSLDIINLQLRMNRITEKYDNFENSYTDLLEGDDGVTYSTEFTEVQDAYFALASKIKGMIDSTTIVRQPGCEGQLSTNGESEASTARTSKRVKLPLADLPKFDGTYEKWISFKNTFDSMIDQRADLNDVEKLIYLRAALVGKAAKKIAIYENTPENYSRARRFLQDSYEIKRLIVSRHLKAICDLPKLKEETHDGIIELADMVQQHESSLQSLGAQVGTDMLVFLIEQKLPDETAKKWELELSNDELPTFKKLCNFLSQTAVRASKREYPISDSDNTKNSKMHSQAKKGKYDNKGSAFVTNAQRTCVLCKNSHLLYQCREFQALPTLQRIAVVKKNNLCQNCLRKHTGRWQRSDCRICKKNHNTLLHIHRDAKGDSNIEHNTANTSNETLSIDKNK